MHFWLLPIKSQTVTNNDCIAISYYIKIDYTQLIDYVLCVIIIHNSIIFFKSRLTDYLTSFNHKGGGFLIMKKILSMIFVDGFNGMAIGIFFTFSLGTILQQIGTIISKDIGDLFITVGGIAITLTGAGIAMGIASKVSMPPMVTLSAALAGMIGAHADSIFESSIITAEGAVKLNGPGDPLGACIAVLITLSIGTLIAGKTELDLLLTPVVCTTIGGICGLFFAPASDTITRTLSRSLLWSITQNEIAMGILIACLMCIFTMLPVSTLTIIHLAMLGDISAGAATIGCCCSMIGFAVASYRDNKICGLVLQGIGTSKLQLANTIKRPYILLPALISSGILGGVSAAVFKLTNTVKGAAYGTTGLLGCIKAYEDMQKSMGSTEALIVVSLLCFVLPGVISLGVAEVLRKVKLLKDGDMKIVM